MDPKNDDFWTKNEVQKVPAPGGSNRPQKVVKNVTSKSDVLKVLQLQTYVVVNFQI